jgi:hypothetical protein
MTQEKKPSGDITADDPTDKSFGENAPNIDDFFGSGGQAKEDAA